MEDKFITLATKPGASLHISLQHAQPGAEPGGEPLTDNSNSNTLVVFLNGLVLPSAAWSSAVEQLSRERRARGEPLPALLCYDRYGQGRSSADPADAEGDGGAYGHDVGAAVADLHQLLVQVARDELGLGDGPGLGLVLVCSSIGCALARLFAAAHPGRVAGLVLLDSMMANTDFVSLFPDPDPDPDGPGFDAGRLPPGVSADDVRHARARFRALFHPTVPNPERLDRRNLAELLPHADRPALPAGPGGRSPLLAVVGHDWDVFAEECEQGSLSVPKSVINAYVNPAWGAYNEGLTRLVQAETPDQKPQVKIAKGCGHFIQKDDPAFVAAEIDNILKALQRRT